MSRSEQIIPLSGLHERDPYDGDTEDHAPRPPTVTGLSQEVHEMKQVTCQFQWISLRVLPQEVDDGPILHPRRHHLILLTVHRDTDQLQHVRVRQTLPNDNLSAKVLQTITLSRDKKVDPRSQQLTFLIF